LSHTELPSLEICLEVIYHAENILPLVLMFP
jgi:hypothetical protein